MKRQSNTEQLSDHPLLSRRVPSVLAKSVSGFPGASSRDSHRSLYTVLPASFNEGIPV